MGRDQERVTRVLDMVPNARGAYISSPPHIPALTLPPTTGLPPHVLHAQHHRLGRHAVPPALQCRTRNVHAHLQRDRLAAPHLDRNRLPDPERALLRDRLRADTVALPRPVVPAAMAHRRARRCAGPAVRDPRCVVQGRGRSEGAADGQLEAGFRRLDVCGEHAAPGRAQRVHVGDEQGREAGLEHGAVCGAGVYRGWCGGGDGVVGGEEGEAD